MKKKTLIIIPHDTPGNIYTREMRCQEKKEVLGTAKPPLTPALLCALFKEKHIPFTVIENTPAREAARILTERGFVPELAAMPTCTPTIERDMSFAAELKSLTGAKIAAFGPHTSGVPEMCMKEFLHLDYAIIGEPEETILELASGEKKVAEICGLAYRNGDTVIVNSKNSGVQQLDSLPFPAWEHFDLSAYRAPLFGKKFLLVETSRGCPHNCGFCVVPLTHGHRLREKAPERIAEEIHEMNKRHGVSFFYFWGDTAVLNRDTMTQLCSLIERDRLDIEWISNTRPEAVQDTDFAVMLRKSGCRMLSLGAESASAGILGAMSKKLNRDSLMTAVSVLKKAGIKTFVFFIFGHPGETSQTMQDTLKLALELDPDYANFYPAVPYPGTPLWEYCIRNGLLKDAAWHSVDFCDYILDIPGLDRAQVLQMVRSARRKFYMRPSYLLKSLRDIASPSRAYELLKAAPAYLKI